MASLPAGRDSLLNEESTPKTGKEEESTLKTAAEEESTRILRGKEKVLIRERRLGPKTADEFTKRSEEALKLRNFTDAINYIEKALRTRISDENKSAPESVKRMLDYADTWLLKAREICESSNIAEPAKSFGDLRAKWKIMTRTISNEILQNLPHDSADKLHVLSILAEANMKKNSSLLDEAISDCITVADLLRSETEKLVNAYVVPAFKSFLQLSVVLDEELRTRSSILQTAGPSNPTEEAEESIPKTEEEEESSPILKGMEQVAIGDRRLEAETADEFTERAEEALKRLDFTEAVYCFENALRIRNRNEDKSPTESIITMLQYADAWLLKGSEICESSSNSTESIPDLRAKLKSMTQTISREVLQSIPDDSAEKEQIVSILVGANKKTRDEAMSNCSVILSQLLHEAKKSGNAGCSHPSAHFVQHANILRKEFDILSALLEDDLTAGPKNPTPK